MWKNLPVEEEDWIEIISILSGEVREIKKFFGITDDLAPSEQPLPDWGKEQSLRLAFYADNDSESFNPARLMLRKFFKVESLSVDGDAKGSIERIQPLPFHPLLPSRAL